MSTHQLAPVKSGLFVPIFQLKYLFKYTLFKWVKKDELTWHFKRFVSLLLDEDEYSGRKRRASEIHVKQRPGECYKLVAVTDRQGVNRDNKCRKKLGCKYVIAFLLAVRNSGQVMAKNAG